MDLSSLGKFLILMGLVLMAVGLAFVFLPRIPLLQNLGRLPGDFRFGKDNFQVYFPFATSVILSIVLSLIFWLLSKWMRP